MSDKILLMHQKRKVNLILILEWKVKELNLDLNRMEFSRSKSAMMSRLIKEKS